LKLLFSEPQNQSFARDETGEFLTGAQRAITGNTESIAVNASIQSAHNLFNADLEHITNTQEGRHCNGTARFDLLPVASGKSEGNHVFLAVFALLTEPLDSAAKRLEEFGVIYHTEFCTVARAETPRAD
jgi:hypothetical protein